MSDYHIPSSAAELFAAGPASYHIIDPEQSGDNIWALSLFCDLVGIPTAWIESDEGTRITVCNGIIRLVIDSGGLGDFDRHGYEVSLAEDQP